MRKICSGLVLFCAVIGACKERVPQVSGVQETTRDWRTGMEIGRGYSAVSEVLSGNCVDFDESTKTTSKSQQTTFRVEMVERSSELATVLNVSASAQLAAIGVSNTAVSPKVQFVTEKALNTYSVYLVIHTKVTNEVTQVPIKTFKIRPTVLPAMKRQFDGAEAASAQMMPVKVDLGEVDLFRSKCGEYFISGYVTGGEYYGIIEIETESEEQKRQVTTEISASGIVGTVTTASATVGTKTELKSLKSVKSVKVWSSQSGGMALESKPVMVIEEMIERAKSLPETVGKNGTESAQKLTALFDDYFSLGIDAPKEFINSLWQAKSFIMQLGEIHGDLMDMKGNIKYILDHPYQFREYTPELATKLKAGLTEVELRIRKVRTIATYFFADMSKTSYPDDIFPPKIDLPERDNSLDPDAGVLGWETSEISSACRQELLTNGNIKLLCNDPFALGELTFLTPKEKNVNGIESVQATLVEDDSWFTWYDDKAGCYNIPRRQGNQIQQKVAKELLEGATPHFKSIVFNPRLKSGNCFELVTVYYK